MPSLVPIGFGEEDCKRKSLQMMDAKLGQKNTLLYLYHLFLVKKIYLDTGIYSI